VNDSLSVNPIIDYDTEFASHLASTDSLEYVLREGITPDLLISPRAKAVYQFARYHYGQTGKAPTEDILVDEFPKFEFNDTETPIEWVVDKIRTRYKKNKVEAVITEAATSIDDPEQAIVVLESELRDIRQQTTSMSTIWTKDDGEQFIRQLQEKILDGGYKGVSLGFLDIDNYTGGLKNGNLGYLLARPKRQKTFFLVNAFMQQIKNGAKPFLYTLENSDEEIRLRLACMASGFSWDKAKSGALMPKDYDMLRQGLDELKQWGDYWIECPPMNERTIDSMMLKAEKVGAESVLISQFRYIKGIKDFYRNPLEEREEVAIDLKRAAVASKKPILVEAQFNRGGDSMEELEDFDASKVGLTDMIPQGADILMGLFGSKDLRESQMVEYGILDSRNTGKAAWHIHYEYIKETELRMIHASQH